MDEPTARSALDGDGPQSNRLLLNEMSRKTDDKKLLSDIDEVNS